MVTIRWYDKDSHELKEKTIDALADVVTVVVSSEERQTLRVDVNADAVIVSTSVGRQIGMLEFNDLLAGYETNNN
jgi:hypothetical protein